MNRSQLPLTNEVRFCVSGTVSIHPTAAIATNVILHANPGSAIEVGAGTVLGRGSIVHAHGGLLVLGTEVTLGTQVLLFGHGTVGAHSCIGSMTTIMGQIQVAAGESVAPHTLRGVPEPRVVSAASGVATASSQTHYSQNIKTNSQNSEKRDSMDAIGENADGSVPNGSMGNQKGGNAVSDNVLNHGDGIANPSPSSKPTEPEPLSPSVVYGQASVQRLISMMFPHRSQPLSENGKE
ncbi:MAG: hypothetical protein VKJ64_13635 [Leptolyngbyaceae bacterium]|nr:hypothetical protein [Leptolyngbyaceae bacterium]